MLFTTSVLAYQETELVDTYIVNKFTRNNVLPTNTVTDIHLSKRGILYAASSEGLIIHDGFNWDVLNTENSPILLSERILKVIETPYGQIFFQDQSNHLYAINIDQEIQLITDPETNQAIKVNAIDVQKNWLIVVNDTKLLSVDQQLSVRGNKHNISGSIWGAIMTDSTLFVISSDGLFRIEQSEEKNFVDDFGIVDINYHSSIEKRDNALLIMGNGGIDCVPLNEQNNCSKYHFKANQNEKVYHITPMGDTNYVISTNQRLIQYTGSDLITLQTDEGLMYESLMNVLDNQVIVSTSGVLVNGNQIFTPTVEIVDAATDGKSLWLTSDQHGIIQITPNKFSHYSTLGFLNSYSVVEKGSEVWAGSFEFGFSNTLSGSDLITTENTELPNNTIRMMGSFSNGDLFLSTWGERPVYFRNNQIYEFPQLQDVAWSTTNVAEGFYEFDNGDVLIGSLEELYVMDEESVRAIKGPGGSAIEGVQRIVADPYSERIFLCTKQNGLYIYEAGVVSPLFDEDDPRHIRDIYITSPNSFWVASYSSGLIHYTLDENGKTLEKKQVDHSNGLPDTGFHRILKGEDDNLWISSNDGLIRVSSTELENAIKTGEPLKSLKVFTEKDGLKNREFNGGSQNTGLVDREGNLWFTNQSGLVKLNPKDFSSENVNIENFYVRNASEDKNSEWWVATDSVILEGWNDFFSLEYAHINTSQNNTAGIWYSVNDRNWRFSEISGTTDPIKLSRGESVVQFAIYPQKEPFYSLTMIRDPMLVNRTWFRLLIGVLVLLSMIGFVFFAKKIKSKKAVALEAERLVEEKKSEVEMISESIHQHYHNPGFNLDDLASKVKMSRSTMYRVWGKEREETLNEYLLSVRLKNAIELLVDEDKTITEAAENSGFRSQSYFSKVFKKHYGLSPSKFLEQSKKVNS